MANYPKYDLTGKSPAATYTELTLYNVESASLVNGSGNDLPQLNITASQAATASYVTNAITASVASNIASPTQVVIRSQDAIVMTATNNIVLDATGALFLSADTSNITMTPRNSVEIQGSLIVDTSITASAISLSNGLTATKSFVDGNNLSHSVFISSGIITAWNIT